jgi:radical SAM superfamily enzyme YgiQ (UPF0313 family)
MPKVILVNPSISTVGYGIITPRWLFVIAQGTPVDLVGDPILVDESIGHFDPEMVDSGDIVGIGISTGNCLAGYRVLKEAKRKGATVIVGGIHATIFPEEPLEMGADAVVTGNGDVVWSRVIKDALEKRLQRQYIGGRMPGEAMLKARWDLLDPTKYLFAAVQTVAGCPENCSFCSVWVTEGRQPRQRLTDKIIEEVNELYGLGFRYIVFADDNFNPATLGRIAREPSENKRREFQRIREERLNFFDQYDRSVPGNIFALTQMTTEVTTDEEYLSAMYRKMRIRGALIGVESFSEQGLKSAAKQWNPVGQKMVETIQKIQDHGILVLSSIICGLEPDAVQTIQTMRKFARESGTILAQFTFYTPYPGTKDFYEMMSDKKNVEGPNFVPKHKTRIREERFWLKPLKEVDIITHANISRNDLLEENKKCWDTFYSVREILGRTRRGIARGWPLAAKFTYLLLSLAFKRIYAGHGVSADSVQRKKTGIITRTTIKTGIGIYNYFFRQERVRVGLKMPLMGLSLLWKRVSFSDSALRQAARDGRGGIFR